MSDQAVQFAIMIFEGTTALGVVGGFLWVFFEVRSGSVHLSARMDRVERQLESQTEILTKLAAGEARMDGIDRRVELLEEGVMKQRVATGMSAN